MIGGRNILVMEIGEIGDFVSSDVILVLFRKWLSLAGLVEKKTKIAPGEKLIWALSLGGDGRPETPFHIEVKVERCGMDTTTAAAEILGSGQEMVRRTRGASVVYIFRKGSSLGFYDERRRKEYLAGVMAKELAAS